METNGWGAYQNKKKEIEKLKKQIIVQDINNYGEVLSIDKNNNFKPIFKDVNPFRFPNKIKSEIEKEDEDVENEDVENEDDENEDDENKNVENKEIVEDKEINDYKLKVSKNDIIINSLINENKKNKKELEDKIKELTKEYEIRLSLNNDKIDKLQKYNKTIEDMIKIKVNLLEIENDIISNNYNKINSNNISEKSSIIDIMKNAFNKQKKDEPENNIIEKIEIIPIYNDNKKGRKKEQISEKRINEGDTEYRCIVEIDDFLYDICYEYCSFTDTIFMSKSSIVKHNGNIINVIYDEKDKRFKFNINNKLIQISYKRPRTNAIKNVFNSDTIIRHKCVNERYTSYERDENGNYMKDENGNYINWNNTITFDEYCIYVKTKNNFFRCDKSGNYNDNDKYKTLSPFIVDNYKKYVPYYSGQQSNSYEYLEYFCKKEECFKSFKELWYDSKVN